MKEYTVIYINCDLEKHEQHVMADTKAQAQEKFLLTCNETVTIVDIWEGI